MRVANAEKILLEDGGKIKQVSKGFKISATRSHFIKIMFCLQV